MKKILVTGGAGFVGSHLCERLSKNKEYQVYSLDNYFTGSEKNHVDNVTYIKGDTREIFDLIDFRPDMVYHLGEYSRVEQSYDDYDLALEMNCLGTIRVLEFVKKHNCKILYAGSSTKYGDGGAGADGSPYAYSKSTNTRLVQDFGKWFGIDYAITYFYNVYGPREIEDGKYATLIAKFLKKYKNGEKLTIVSPGTQKRNFTHIDDIIDGLVLVGENGHGDEFGIGNDKAYSILEIASMFNCGIEMLDARKGNRMTADVITEKTKALGWESKRNLDDYITKELSKINV